MHFVSYKRLQAVVFFALALTAWTARSAAQDAVGDKPWAKNVSPEQREQARPLFESGNEHFARSSFSSALKDYRKAITHWDHPAIRFNMAVCLINLEQPIEAYENLVASMKYGEDAFDRRLYVEAQTYLALLRGQLATLRILTSEGGAKVALDGEELFVGPGEVTRLVLPKSHQITASKAEMLTLTRDFIPTAGEETRIHLKMIPLSEGIVTRRRWSAWKPWAVVAGGASLAALAVPLYFFAQSNLDRYDEGVREECPGGCSKTGGRLPPLPGDLAELEDRARVQEIASISLLVTGGIALTSGAVLLYLNRPRAFEREMPGTSDGPSAAAPSSLRVTPMVGGERSGVLATYGFQF